MDGMTAVPTRPIIPHYPQPSLRTSGSQSITLNAVHCLARHLLSGYNVITSSVVNAVIALWTIAVDVNGQCLSAWRVGHKKRGMPEMGYVRL